MFNGLGQVYTTLHTHAHTHRSVGRCICQSNTHMFLTFITELYSSYVVYTEFNTEHRFTAGPHWTLLSMLALTETGEDTSQSWTNTTTSPRHGERTRQQLAVRETPPSTGAGGSCRFPLQVLFSNKTPRAHRTSRKCTRQDRFTHVGQKMITFHRENNNFLVVSSLIGC